MKTIAKEFRSISESYREVGEVLSRILQLDESQRSEFITSVLGHRDCLGRIESMNSNVVRISDEWKKRRADTDSREWDEIARLADEALQQAVRLNRLCSLTEKRIQSAKEGLARELEELSKGARFMKCAKPRQANYPKFIDSMG